MIDRDKLNDKNKRRMEVLYKISFKPDLHKRLLQDVLLSKMPPSMSSLDSNRLVIAYFAAGGLDLLGAIPDQLSESERLSIIDWVYSLQVVDDNELTSGFQVCSAVNTKENRGTNSLYKWGHIAGTYAGLCILLILGDNFERVNRSAITRSLRALQLPDGCFKAAKEGTEYDMRFVFCAAAISYILDDWSGIDIDLMVDFILSSISYDYGIGQGPGLEAHSGSTYCAIAALSLSNQLHRLSKTQREGLIRWLLNRLDYGFSGRPNKPVDTCYSFWTGAALKLLNAYHFIHQPDNNQFVLVTQDRRGGFSKWVNCQPDPMHTYLALAGLTFMEQKELLPVVPDLNLSVRAHEHLEKLKHSWNIH